MVIVVADDPGPISSQTELDTRTYAAFSKLPCLDPSTPQEAYEMVQYAFELSENTTHQFFSARQQELTMLTRALSSQSCSLAVHQVLLKKILPAG